MSAATQFDFSRKSPMKYSKAIGEIQIFKKKINAEFGREGANGHANCPAILG
jgi:hypothetical protein